MPSAQSLILTEEHPHGIALVRDGEVLTTPKQNEVVLPHQTLAEAVADDFGAQSAGNIKKLTYTVLDQVEEARDIIVESMLTYLHTDTICYMSEDPELQQYERKHWQPIIDWVEERFVCRLEIFEGVMPGDQSEETAEAISAHIESYNNWQLTALMDLGTHLSSLLLALAVMEGRLDVEQAFECAYADELYQNEKWGADEEAEARREKIRAELKETARFLGML